MTITKNNLNDIFRAKKCSVETMELKGYKLIEELFVDNSGFGLDNEPAYTKSQFEKALIDLLDKYPKMTAKIINAGQFQVYVGLFIKEGKSKCKKIANNTLAIYNDDGSIKAIRLHDTDIITYKGNKIILNSGGYETRTTKDRLNINLPNGYYIFQKNFNWFLKKPDGSIIDFIDGLSINL